MKEYLYIGYDLTGLYKIGITKDPEKRLQQLKTGNPFFAYLSVFQVKNASISELDLHTTFYKKRVQGEWFKLDQDDLKYILEKHWMRNDISESFVERIVKAIKKKKSVVLPEEDANE